MSEFDNLIKTSTTKTRSNQVNKLKYIVFQIESIF